ncbi:MAG: ATP-binding protein [Myxococcota bacterium]
MASYEDLTEVGARFGNWRRLRAVGWLDRDTPSARGSVPAAFLTRLRAELSDWPWRPPELTTLQYVSRCELCADGGRALLEPWPAAELLFVPSPRGAFVAPSVIRHHIEVHGYAPPQEFIEALIACPPMASDAYREAIARDWIGQPSATQPFESVIRLRPSLYIGGTDARALGEMIAQVLNNGIEEHLAGHASRVSIDVTEGWITVEDDGRGIPVDPATFTATFRDFELGGHRILPAGYAVATALSSRLELETRRHGRRWTAAWERGELVEPLTDAGATRARGARIRLLPDEEIFGRTRLSVEALAARLDTLAHFTPRLELRLNGHPYQHPRGLQEWLPSLSSDLVEETQLAGAAMHDGVFVEYALAWSPTRRRRRLVPWVNLVATPRYRAHRAGLVAALAASAPTKRAFDAMTRGLVAVLHARTLHAQDDARLRAAVEAEVSRALSAAPWWWDRVLELSR